MERGQIRGCGTFESVMREVNSDFAENLKSFNTTKATDQPVIAVKDSEEIFTCHAPSSLIPDGKLESKSVGSVKRSVYYKFLRAGLPLIVLVLLSVLMVAGEVLLIYSVFWLSKWSQKSEAEQQATLWYNIEIFVAFSVSTFMVSLIRALWFYLTCLRSSRLLFEEMMRNVFRVSMDFFHNNPHGRIMNRFSKDINILDETLPLTFFDFLQCCSMVIGSLIITVISLPNALIVYPFLFIFFLHLRKRYVATSRQLKRAEGISRSPVYSTITSTLEGISLIRAFNAEDRFLDRFFFLQNENTRIFFTYLTAARWLGLRLDMLVTLLVLVSAVLCVVLKAQLNLSGGVVGIVFLYLLENVGLIQWGVRLSTEVENIMVSAERAYEYTELPSEAPEITSIRPPPDWPENGNISVQNLSLTYPGSSRQVLKHISFTVCPGEKIGIVGRTGAGKSSLLQALFRIVEPETLDAITIDGISITSLGLRDLRSNLSIIPQEPFCFKGTLRFNLDPFGAFDDQRLWDALEAVELKPAVKSMPLKLESMVEENGSNWSVGERQLICLARTVLRNSKIVVMDEATSSVDVRTDACIQKAIRDDHGMFSSATVLTIAHRLNTVIDYDKILVLDDGQVVEFGCPQDLIKKSTDDPTAWFARMVSDLGST